MRKNSLKHFSSHFGRFNKRHRKRSFNSSDPLDYCYEKGLISYEEHKAGIEFRKLHITKFGIKTITSNFPLQGYRCGKTLSDSEIMYRHSKYEKICRHLRKQKLLRVMLDICVYTVTPAFISAPGTFRATHEFENFSSGIGELKSVIKKLSEGH